MARLAVVILNYNRGDLLRACLRSIEQAQSRHDVQVWVVDNASADDSVSVVRNEFPTVRLLVSERNGGFAAGNNLALREIMGPHPLTPSPVASDGRGGIDLTSPLPTLATGEGPGVRADYIMLLNNDTEVASGTLDALVDYLEAHADAGAVGPKVLLMDGSLDLACRRSFPTPEVSFYRMTGLSRLFPRSPRFGRYNMTYRDVDDEVEVDALVGAAMMLRAGVVREVGLLDERFFMYGEDLDWCFRIKSYGWRIVYVPRAVVHHHKRAASTRRAIPSIRAFYDAMRIFHRKHYARRTVAPLNWIVEASITAKEYWALGRNLLRPAARRQVS